MSTFGLVFSDLQAGEGAERLRANPAIPLQRWRVERCYADLAHLMRQHKCKYLIDLGDTTDDRYAIPVPTLEVVMRGLDMCRPKPLLSFKLIGNHEQALKANHLHPGGVYKAHHRVVSGHEVVLRGDLAIIAVAWPNEGPPISAWINDRLRDLKDRGFRTLLLGHLQVTGAKAHGTELPGEHNIDPSLVDLALLGHVHASQSTHENIHYIGSPFQQDYGEGGQSKRVGLIDFDTLDFQWLSLPSAYPRYLHLDFREFAAQKSLGEDRVQVTLRTPIEADAFHQHPLASQVTPVYALTVSQATVTEKAEDTPITPEDLLRLYVQRNPLHGVDEEAILAAGYVLMGV